MKQLIPIARAADFLNLFPSMANRHGLIAGATGTGKTVSLQVFAEGLSAAGVSVFLADVKGDLAGLAAAGKESAKLSERLAKLGIRDHAYSSFPVVFWDLFGKKGHPIRSTVSDLGPLLLGRLLNLNEIQAGVLSIIFKVADDNGLLLLDMKDLKAMLVHASKQASEITRAYGMVTAQSIGIIQRSLFQLEQEGGEHFFGEPAFEIGDLLASNADGAGTIHILTADILIQKPRLYSVFLLWLLSELFENLPERGDLDKPEIVFFFDEAHLLFDDAPKVLLDKVEQVVRLIRSRGVGVFFVTQNPVDIPEDVAGQLGNRVQHALRAYTPKDQKAVKAAAQTFRQNPSLSVESSITELGIGEALVSLLDGEGVPAMVERAWILPPKSRIGVINDSERGEVLAASVFKNKYDNAVDRESAYERLAAKTAAESRQAPAGGSSRVVPLGSGSGKGTMRVIGSGGGSLRSTGGSGRTRSVSPASDFLGALVGSATRTMGRQVGSKIVRGILGSMWK